MDQGSMDPFSGPGVHRPLLWTRSMDPLQVQNTGYRSRVIVLPIQKVSQTLIKANLRPKNFCLGLIKKFCLGLIRPKVSFYNVWDTFCIVKAMTCDLCFVPAGGPWTWSREEAHGPLVHVLSLPASISKPRQFLESIEV